MKDDIMIQLEKYRHDERIPLGVLVFIGLIFLVYLVSWVGDFHVMPAQSGPSAITPVPPVSSLSQWHLFGAYNDSFADVPETTLALTLEGIMMDLSNDKQSYVIVSSPGTPAMPYKIGDPLPGGATLSKILQQQVIIDDQGTAQSLSLPVDQL